MRRHAACYGDQHSLLTMQCLVMPATHGSYSLVLCLFALTLLQVLPCCLCTRAYLTITNFVNHTFTLTR